MVEAMVIEAVVSLGAAAICVQSALVASKSVPVMVPRQFSVMVEAEQL